MANVSGSGLVEPQQTRSRESLSRVLNAALQLLVERGDDSLTIAQVSELSRVSVGSIYARFEGKNAIVRTVQARELDRVDHRSREALETAVSTKGTFEEKVRAVIAARVMVLADEAPILTALMRSADHDPTLVARGRKSATLAQGLFVSALTRLCDESGLPASRAQVEWCDELVYSVASRHLGLGVGVSFAPVRKFDASLIVDGLTSTLLGLLRSEHGPGTAPTP